MMVSLPPDTWSGCSFWTVIGLLIYICYGYKHSELRKTER
jgi:hypothetical protein